MAGIEKGNSHICSHIVISLRITRQWQPAHHLTQRWDLQRFFVFLAYPPPAHQSTPSSSKHHWRSVLSSSGWRRDEKEVLDGGQTKSNVTTKNMITISYCQQERCRCHQEHNPIVIYRHGCELVKQPIHYHSTFCFCMSGVAVNTDHLPPLAPPFCYHNNATRPDTGSLGHNSAH